MGQVCAPALRARGVRVRMTMKPWQVISALAVFIMAVLIVLAWPKPTTTTALPAATATASTTSTLTPTAVATSTPTSTPSRRPQSFLLPTECQYVDNGTVDGSATSWKISCPQGLPSNYLRPSLEAQGWTSCGAKVWQKSALQIAIIDAVNVSGFSGWLDQRPITGSTCVQPTPPPN